MRCYSRAAVVLTMSMVSAPAMAESVVLAGPVAPLAGVSGMSSADAAELSAMPDAGATAVGVVPAVVLDKPTFPACNGMIGMAVSGCGAEEATAVKPAAGWDLADLRPPINLAVASEIERPSGYGDANCQAGCLSGPALEQRGWADHVPSEYAARSGFWDQVGTVKTETLLLLGYFTIQSGSKLFEETKPFGFKDEGWFGKNTPDIGVDKLAHAYNTYLMAEFLHNRIHRRSGASEGDAVTAAVLASGLTIFNEISDGIEPGGGWSFQDVVMDLAGAGFSVLRNTVPGLKEKVAFKLEIMPNEDIYSYSGKPHFEQERFLFSIKGAGFEKLARTPLRFLDLQIGYYASDFRLEDRAAGIEPKRHLFVGLGLNLGELLFGESRSGFGKAAYSVLDYMQLPYTSIRYDTTGRLGY